MLQPRREHESSPSADGSAYALSPIAGAGGARPACDDEWAVARDGVGSAAGSGFGTRTATATGGALATYGVW